MALCALFLVSAGADAYPTYENVGRVSVAATRLLAYFTQAEH